MGLSGLMACEKSTPPEYEVLTEKYWKEKAPAVSNLIDKVGLPSSELMLNLRIQNKKEGRTEPSTLGIEARDFELVQSALKTLPSKLQKTMNSKLVSIAIVNDLGSSGYSDFVYTADGYPVQGFIVLDRKLLKQSSNQWFTARENSPFSCDRLVAKLGSDQNDFYSSIKYVVLHEFAHVFSEGTSVNQFTHDLPDQKELDRRDYAPMSWKVINGQYVSKFNQQFPEREKIRYYPTARSSLSCDDASKTYLKLKQTNFPALYAALDPFEDFAESFANYIHVVVMKRPFEIVIQGGGKPVERFTPCWNDSRCVPKKTYMDKLYLTFPE